MHNHLQIFLHFLLPLISPVLALVVLDMLVSPDWNLERGQLTTFGPQEVNSPLLDFAHLCVSSHHIVVHDCLPAEERETSRAGLVGRMSKSDKLNLPAQDTAQDVFCGFLKPMTHLRGQDVNCAPERGKGILTAYSKVW